MPVARRSVCAPKIKILTYRQPAVIGIGSAPLAVWQSAIAHSILNPRLPTREEAQELSECKRCRNPHLSSEGELCKLCSYEEKNPFSAAMPKEVLKTLSPQLQEKLRGV